MTEITQSTSIQCSKQDLLDFFSQPLPLITLDANAPSLLYHISNDASENNKQINWSFYHGLFHLKWKSKVTEYTPFKIMRSKLESGPFSKFIHEQSIEFRGLKIYLHDKINFECNDSELSQSLKDCILRYQFEVLLEENSRKVTQKIHAIQQKTA